MLKLNLSRNLERDLAAHLRPADVAALHPQQWYLQKTTVLRRKCIIAMEEKSRYAMVFSGLTKSEFAIFPQLFQERLWRETMAICQLDEADNARLSDLTEQQPAAVVSDRQRPQRAGSSEGGDLALPMEC